MTDADVVKETSCGFCGASRGSVCVDTRSGHPTRGPHPSRVEAAGWSAVGEQPDPPDDRYDRDRD